MTVRVAINGFGRIGRLVLRSIVEHGRRVACDEEGPQAEGGHEGCAGDADAHGIDHARRDVDAGADSGAVGSADDVRVVHAGEHREEVRIRGRPAGLARAASSRSSMK